MKKTLVRVTLFFGILHFYNIVAHSNNLLDLSNSIHWITDWWDYCVWLLFDWLNIEIPKVVRNLVVMYFLCVGIVNYALIRDGHPSLFYLFADMFLSDGRDAIPFIISQFDKFEGLFASFFRLVVVATVLFGIWAFVIDSDNTLSYEPWFTVPAMFFMSMGNISLLIYHHRADPEYLEEKVFKDAKFFRILNAVFFSFFGFFTMAAIIYRFEIFKILRWILLLFGLELVMTYVIDPFAPLLADLPDPPKTD